MDLSYIVNSPDVERIAAALETISDDVSDAISGKVDVQQGTSNVGKALVVGDDGAVTLGDAGISTDVAEALLNIFRHVAYTDAQGQVYYDALRDALEASRWIWQQSSGDFLVQHNTAGYQEGIGANIYLDTVSTKENTRRRLVIGDGSAAYVYYQSGGTPSESEYYPIPVPSGANCLQITTQTAGLTVAFQLVKLVNGAYQIYEEQTDVFSEPPVVRYFDNSHNLYLMVYIRRDDNTAFDDATEPAGMVVEFSNVDYNNIHRWSTETKMLLVSKGAPGSYNNTCGYNEGDYPNVRRCLWARQGVLGAYHNDTQEYSDVYYPIPVPDDATVLNIKLVNATALPNTMYAVAQWLYDASANAYTRIVNGSWVAQGTDIQLSTNTGRYVTINFKASSSGSTDFPVDPKVIVTFA